MTGRVKTMERAHRRQFKDRNLDFRHPKFEMAVRHPCGDLRGHLDSLV